MSYEDCAYPEYVITLDMGMGMHWASATAAAQRQNKM